jgi:hypothetical protein
MKYILEIYYKGECIEQRWYAEPFIPPIFGDEIYIEFQTIIISMNMETGGK